MASLFHKAVLAVGCGSAALFCTVWDTEKLNNQKEKCFSKIRAICATPVSGNVTPAPIVENRQFFIDSWDWNWDKRDTKCDPDMPKLQRTKKHYIFVRHGDYNTKGCDDNERYLTPLGLEQANLTGEWLGSLDLNYTRIVESTMTRAKETCAIISKFLPNVKVETTDLLREGSPTPPDPPNRANEPELKYFSDAPRIESAFRKFVYRPKLLDVDESVEVYVCHANVIRYFLCRVAQFPPQGWLRISLRHGSITWVTVYSDGDVFVRCIGDTGYMPPAKLSR